MDGRAMDSGAMDGRVRAAWTDAVRRAARPLGSMHEGYDKLLERIGEARLVLIGEGSHGTHEFYRERVAITRRLIVEKGFHAVAVEADWPDAYRVNRFVRGSNENPDADRALSGFRRFPTWMWRNREVLDFVEWLRAHNDALPPGAERVGFYGLDLYSLYSSIEKVLAYLARIDPVAARVARERYACFDHFSEAQDYGFSSVFGRHESCESEVVQELEEMRRNAWEYERRDGRAAADDFFVAVQNAHVVKNAEAYYRAMFHGRKSSWNLRDEHMVETLGDLIDHLARTVPQPRVVVWAHNSHLGDARATEMGEHGELNVGQLVRQRWGGDAFLIGQTTYEGAVTAANDWDEPATRMKVVPGMEGSYERLFHDAGIGDFLLLATDPDAGGIPVRRLERAIGVVYRPRTERISHYFEAEVTRQFDAVLHFDRTRAVEPLERGVAWSEEREAEETYPSGL